MKELLRTSPALETLHTRENRTSKEAPNLGRTPRGSCNRTLLRRVLRRFSNSKCFLEGFLEGACKVFFSKDRVLRRVLRRECFIEGAWKVLRRQKHVLSQSTTPFACTLKLLGSSAVPSSNHLLGEILRTTFRQFLSIVPPPCGNISQSSPEFGQFESVLVTVSQV